MFLTGTTTDKLSQIGEEDGKRILRRKVSQPEPTGGSATGNRNSVCGCHESAVPPADLLLTQLFTEPHYVRQLAALRQRMGLLRLKLADVVALSERRKLIARRNIYRKRLAVILREFCAVVLVIGVEIVLLKLVLFRGGQLQRV